MIEPTKILPTITAMTGKKQAITQKAASGLYTACNDALKNLANSAAAQAKAAINMQKTGQNTTRKLPLIFASADDTLKEACRKSNAFQSFVKRELKDSEKIIKDAYSNEDLLGKLYTADEFVHSKRGFTDAIHDCIAVILYSKDDAYMLHLSPGKHKTPSQIEHMQKRLGEFIESLGSKNEKCRAVLVGGEPKASKGLYENIMQVLKRKNISADEFLFDKSKSPHTVYFNVDEGILIDNLMFFDTDDLKSCFEKVVIRP